jgi:hypothetical protein
MTHLVGREDPTNVASTLMANDPPLQDMPAFEGGDLGELDHQREHPNRDDRLAAASSSFRKN